jgi:hypothetical protein
VGIEEVGLLVSPGGLPVTLDPGSITITGPDGKIVPLAGTNSPGYFAADLDVDSIPAAGGAFTSHGGGGADVGSFTATLSLTNPLIKPAASATVQSSVDRAQGYSISWEGGNPGTFVNILGGSTSRLGVNVVFSCKVPVDAKHFTVPPYIMLGLPAGGGGATVGNMVSALFSALGLNTAQMTATISFTTNAAFQ